METGVLFDIDALNELAAVTYGTAAWSILMRALQPAAFSNCTFLHGDVDIQAIKRPYSFCICIDPLLDEKGDRFVDALRQCTSESLLPLERRFARGAFYRLLVPAGRIDSRGRFVVAGNQQWLFRSAAAAGWQFLPSDDWLGSFASEFLLRVEPYNVLPWDDEFAELARQALREAGPATLVALDQYLDTVLKETEMAAACRDRMGFLEALFGLGEEAPETAGDGESKGRRGLGKLLFGGTSGRRCMDELEEARAWAGDSCWQPALWWAAKALEIDPHCRAAKELFVKALPGTTVGLVTNLAGYKDRVEPTLALLRRGHLTAQEADGVVDVLVSICYMEWMQEQCAPLLERFNKGEIGDSWRPAASDVKTARDMAASLADEVLPDQKGGVRWKPMMGEEGDDFIDKNIRTQRQAAKVLVAAESPADWTRTCLSVADLFERFESERELAASFRRSATDVLDEQEFAKQRDTFYTLFARNAAFMTWTKRTLREPEGYSRETARRGEARKDDARQSVDVANGDSIIDGRFGALKQTTTTSDRDDPPAILSGVLQHRRDLGTIRVDNAYLRDSDVATTVFGDEVLVAIVRGERSGAIVLLKLPWLVDLAQELGCPPDDIGYAVMCASMVASLVKRRASGPGDAVSCARAIASLAKLRMMPDDSDTEWRSFDFDTVTDGNSMFDNLGPSWVVPCLTVFLWSSGRGDSEKGG